MLNNETNKIKQWRVWNVDGIGIINAYTYTYTYTLDKDLREESTSRQEHENEWTTSRQEHENEWTRIIVYEQNVMEQHWTILNWCDVMWCELVWCSHHTNIEWHWGDGDSKLTSLFVWCFKWKHRLECKLTKVQSTYNPRWIT